MPLGGTHSSLPVSHIEQEIQTGPLTPVSKVLRRGANHSYRPSGCAALGTAQDAFALLCSQDALLRHTHLAIYTSFPAELLQSCSTTANHIPACINTGTLPSQLSHLTFLYFDFHMVPAGPFLQSAWIHLNGHPALKHINWSHGLISSTNLMTVHSLHLLQVTEKARKLFEVKPLDFVKNPVLIIFINPFFKH